MSDLLTQAAAMFFDMENEKRSLKDRIYELEEQLWAAQESMVRHFNEEHLAGDGPEIDRWKLKLQAAETRAEQLAKDAEYYKTRYGDCLEREKRLLEAGLLRETDPRKAGE